MRTGSSSVRTAIVLVVLYGIWLSFYGGSILDWLWVMGTVVVGFWVIRAIDQT